MNAHVTVGLFSPSVALLAADRRGFFAGQDIDVSFERVSSSRQQFEDLNNGRYDVVQTALDNVANYRLNGSCGAIPVYAFLTLDSGMRLSVWLRPGIDGREQLREHIVAVDADDSGFAYVLYSLLARAGLERGSYTVRQVGGVSERFESLRAGTIDGTLLSNGFDLRAEIAGCKLAGDVGEIAPGYVGSVLATVERSPMDEVGLRTRFVDAYLMRLAWSSDPANREESISLIAEARHVDPAMASRMYEVESRPETGSAPGGRASRSGVRAVLDLRQSYGGFDSPVDVDYLCTPDAGVYVGPRDPVL